MILAVVVLADTEDNQVLMKEVGESHSPLHLEQVVLRNYQDNPEVLRTLVDSLLDHTAVPVEGMAGSKGPEHEVAGHRAS